ncbi:MAG: hypothetical protein ACFFDF_13565, partial [Candidatus Odinarchaeota archaeon]
LNEFKSIFLNEIHSMIKKLLKTFKVGSTIIFDLKKMQHTPFFKYSKKILEIRKDEFESSEIIKYYGKNKTYYDMSGIYETYYGKKFFEILQFEEELNLKSNKFKKFRDLSSNLNLKINLIDVDH